MSTTHRLAARIVLVCALAALTACAAKKPKEPAAELSPSSRITYDYLLYQDALSRMQRLALRPRPTPEIMNELYAQQELAAQALDRVLKAEPKAQLFAEKAGLYWNTRQINDARAILKEGLERYPGDRELTMHLANSYIVEGRSADAAVTMAKYLKAKPDDVNMRTRLAQVLIDANKHAQALDELKKIPQERRTAEVLFLFARAEANVGLRRQAIETLKRAVKKEPEFIEAWAELAFQYELEKDYARAEETYNRILAIGELRDEVRVRLIHLNLKLNNPDKALGLALEGPKTKSFVLDSVAVFLSEGFPAQASTLLDVLASRRPVPTEYYFYKAVIAFEGENDPKKALGFLDKVPENDQHFAQALQFKAQLHQALGQEEEFAATLEQGKRLFPDQVRFFLIHGAHLINKKDHAQAKDVLLEGLKRKPDDLDLQFELGMALEGLGDRKGALSTMEKVLTKNPDHAEALNYVGYTLAEENRDLDRALVLVQSALKQEPENGYMIDSLAWVQFRLHRVDEAWASIQRAVEIVTDDPTIWEHYGDIAKAARKKDKAARGYKNALKFKTEHAGQVKGKLKSL